MRRPDDWHVHLRDGEVLATVLPFTAWQFARAVVMPNLVPPITTVPAAQAYRERILAAFRSHRATPSPPSPASPGDRATGPSEEIAWRRRRADSPGRGGLGWGLAAEEMRFTPLMTCYLTDAADPEEVARGYEAGVFAAVKLYPAHATTNSAHGVTSIDRVMPVLERMAGLGVPLLVHGEVADPEVDIFDREAVFIERVLDPLRRRLPELRIVLEHITTEEAVNYVASSGPNLAATITAHHLVINRNAIFAGGIRPHLYCLPIAKREKHRRALRRAAASGNEKFFLGTDSAPHAVAAKETACGCAGIFTAPCAIEIYAEVFEEEGSLDGLEAFASLTGPKFYKLPPNEGRITLRREAWVVPQRIGNGDNAVVPFRAGETLRWRLQG